MLFVFDGNPPAPGCLALKGSDVVRWVVDKMVEQIVASLSTSSGTWHARARESIEREVTVVDVEERE